VTLNDRLDYFGSTVNIAARLETLSKGDDVIVSIAVHEDPEVAEWLADPGSGLAVYPVKTTLKGFDEEHFDLCSIRFVTHD
jgi:class 3 adenylate cyclase